MKFNIITRKTKRTLNFEGERAIRLSPSMELYTAVVTAGLGNQFYMKESEKLNRIRKLVAEVDPMFTAKLAVYARTKMNLRSVPLILITELARIHRGDSLVSSAVAKVVNRADEITELLACYALMNNRTGYKKLNRLSKQIQKGLANSFNRFDEYQFAKYDRKTEISLRDALFLVRPKADSNERQLLFNKIAEQKLDTPYTWEVELSQLGQRNFTSQAERKAAFREKWEEMIASGKLGYMALLRNLRNILESEVRAEFIEIAGNRLRSEDEVARSRQLPFRFLSAYRELRSVKSEFTSYFLDCLEEAVTSSVNNLSGFSLDTRIVIACDVSGSMYSRLSRKSIIRYFDVGLLLGMLMNMKSKNVITGIFGSKWEEMALPSTQVLANTELLNRIEGRVGYATNGYKVIESLLKSERAVAKVMMFTDCQMWNSSGDGKTFQKLWKKYKESIAPNARLYLFDLAGYGTAPLKIERNDVFLIGGWSDKIFDVLTAIENGESALSEIERIEL